MTFSKKYFSFVLVSLFLFSAPAYAKSVRSANTEAELISEVKSVKAGESFWVTLRLKMDEHWHVYWQNPGDAGIPPKVEWELPDGYKTGPIQWPYPQIIELDPLVNYGFEGEVYLPMMITVPEDVGELKFLKLEAKATWLACKVQCVPGEASLNVVVQVTEGPSEIYTFYKPAFRKARESLPLEITQWEVAAEVYDDHYLIKLLPTYAMLAKNSEAYFFPFKDDIINHAAKQTFGWRQIRYVLFVERSTLNPNPPERIQGILYSPQGWDGEGKRKSLAIDIPLNIVKKN